ncbi:hypothetical protein ANN_02942 [Periplaneta americana]|uniref:Uncharacterized protein n=1 Tax=Periplaneta americana TaxID=6978 RepID=A0ABQ8TXQ1_PERAM|nr:hypothetical protein ANN_02942 [Periplaneta americana]
MGKPMTPSGIEPPTFRLAMLCLNRNATTCPQVEYTALVDTGQTVEICHQLISVLLPSAFRPPFDSTELIRQNVSAAKAMDNHLLPSSINLTHCFYAFLRRDVIITIAMSTKEFSEALPEKKLRFRSTPKIHYANENKVEDVLRSTDFRGKWDDIRGTRETEEMKRRKG